MGVGGRPGWGGAVLGLWGSSSRCSHTHTQVRGRCRHSKLRAQYPEHSQLNLRQVRCRPGLKGPWAPRVRSSYSYLLLPGKTEAQAGVLQVAGWGAEPAAPFRLTVRFQRSELPSPPWRPCWGCAVSKPGWSRRLGQTPAPWASPSSTHRSVYQTVQPFELC